MGLPPLEPIAPPTMKTAADPDADPDPDPDADAADADAARGGSTAAAAMAASTAAVGAVHAKLCSYNLAGALARGCNPNVIRAATLCDAGSRPM